MFILQRSSKELPLGLRLMLKVVAVKGNYMKSKKQEEQEYIVSRQFYTEVLKKLSKEQGIAPWLIETVILKACYSSLYNDLGKEDFNKILSDADWDAKVMERAAEKHNQRSLSESS